MYPILFHIGPYAVHSYGVLLMLSFVVGLGRAYRVARRRQEQDPTWPVAPEDVLDVGIWMILASIIGARLMFVAIEWSSYRAHPADILRVWEGGVSFHGGFFGAILALGLFCWRRRVPFLPLADLLAPTAMLGYAIGRVGCFLNGCCYGAPTGLPWGVRFWDDDHWTVPSHPAQLYATALSLVFFAILVRMERRPVFAGRISCWYLIFSATERFIMEIWRAGTTSDVLALGLTAVQWLCLAIAVVGVVWMQALLRRRKRPQAPTAPPRAQRTAGLQG